MIRVTTASPAPQFRDSFPLLPASTFPGRGVAPHVHDTHVRAALVALERLIQLVNWFPGARLAHGELYDGFALMAAHFSRHALPVGRGREFDADVFHKMRQMPQVDRVVAGFAVAGGHHDGVYRGMRVLIRQTQAWHGVKRHDP